MNENDNLLAIPPSGGSAMKAGAFLWAIRHKPSNTFLPQLNVGRGWTRIEVDQFLPISLVPRLFVSRAAASKALSSWLKGAWEAVRDSDYDDWSGRSYRFVCGGRPPAERPTNRVPEDMEIVPVKCEAVIAHAPESAGASNGIPNA